jgi:hypothetical protein
MIDERPRHCNARPAAAFAIPDCRALPFAYRSAVRRGEAALKLLGDGAVRDIRIVEGVS